MKEEKGGPYEVEIISPAAYRTAIRNNQLLVIALIAVGVVAIVEAVVIVSLFPLKTIETKYVEFVDGTSNFVRVTQPHQTIQGDAVLTDYFVKKYIVDRETVDKVTEEDRYAYVMAVSSQQVWSDMKAIFSHPKSPHRRSDFKRAVKIGPVSNLGKTVRQVEFMTTDSYGAGTGTYSEIKRYWVASLRLDFGEHTAPYVEADLNPLGLRVMEYSIAERKEI